MVKRAQENVVGCVGITAMYHKSLLELQEILGENIINPNHEFYEAGQTVDVRKSVALRKKELVR